MTNEALADKLDARLNRDRNGNYDIELGFKIGPGLYEEIGDAVKVLRQPAVTTGAEPVAWRDALLIELKALQAIACDGRYSAVAIGMRVRNCWEIYDQAIRELTLPAANTAGDGREAIAEMRQTAKELRATPGGGCDVIQQAIMWEAKASKLERALSTPTPAPAVTGDVRVTLELCADVLRVVQATYKCPDSPIINLAREKAKAALSQRAPATDATREQIAEMLKRNGFTSRDGTVINGGTYGVIDAILSLTRPHRGYAE